MFTAAAHAAAIGRVFILTHAYAALAGGANLEAGSQIAYVHAGRVSARYFDVLGGKHEAGCIPRAVQNGDRVFRIDRGKKCRRDFGERRITRPELKIANHERSPRSQNHREAKSPRNPQQDRA